MKKSLLRSKLVKIVSNLDEIICSETEQARGLAVVKKCRDELQRVLVKLNTRGVVVDINAVLLRIYRLIDCVHFFICGKS